MFGQKNWYVAKPYGCFPSRRWGEEQGVSGWETEGQCQGGAEGQDAQTGNRVRGSWGTLDAHMHAKSLQSCLTLCDPMDRSLTGYSVHGILQAQALEWVVTCPPPGYPPDPGIEPVSLTSPALADGFFTTSATWMSRMKISSYFVSQKPGLDPFPWVPAGTFSA